MNHRRGLIWCILLKINVDDLRKKIPISYLVSNASKALTNQVNCDVDRCALINGHLKIKLKELIISVFTFHKSKISYIQGVHELGSVFLNLFFECYNSNYSIKREKLSLDSSKLINSCEYKGILNVIKNKQKTTSGKMDLCFRTFERFLFIYSTPFVLKNDYLNQLDLESILLIIAEDLTSLIDINSPILQRIFVCSAEESEPKSSLFMFILPWLITWFTHNITVKSNKLLFILFDNYILNHPLYIIFLIREILIQSQVKLVNYLDQYFTSERLQELTSNEIYPYIHSFFQSIDMSRLPWDDIINNSKNSISNVNIKELRSYKLWNIEKYDNFVDNGLNFLEKPHLSLQYLTIELFIYLGTIIIHFINRFTLL
ncbi:TBC domain-containing protein [Cryptosporidium felis]|nr:TBC domain-containing protein [Cryptosporidium felis]